MKNYTRIVDKRDSPYLKVYRHNKTGNIKLVYPKAPVWAQKAAMLIYYDMYQGPPTPKGEKDLVRCLWAKIISETYKESRCPKSKK